jgi:hypothetical protein
MLQLTTSAQTPKLLRFCLQHTIFFLNIVVAKPDNDLAQRLHASHQQELRPKTLNFQTFGLDS